MKRLIIDMPGIMRAVDHKRKKAGTSWLEVSNELGFKSGSSIHNMRNGAGSRSDRIIAILLWLGTTDFAPYLIEVDDE